ncbi:chromatin modification-related protein EAF1 B-like isoform X2 [Euphorbia lathyris]|uniref:chromatin modification-related protein EAF1 B-like isoform X2 n=1 Tax=Euphorbia lathyris TaxID=212925 RepID=UPI003313A2C4
MNWIDVGTNGWGKLVAIKVGMHGCGSGSALLVNAEVDSMGGVVDGGVGIGIKTSPRRAAIERAQAELRQEYDVREERRRELDFLEKGGNPLDFKFGNAASVSVQSTSLTDHHTEHFVTSEAKGSFALTASPHGDSVESSGRPGAPLVCEPNSADNFDGENEILEGERKLKHPNRRSNVAPSQQSFQMDGTQIAKESEDSAIVRPYARRNRSRPNRDGARSSSTDIAQSSVGHGSFIKVHGALRNVKGSVPETNNQKERVIPSLSNPKSTTSNGDMASPIEIANTQSNVELDGNLAVDTTASPCKGGAPEDRLDALDTNILRENQCEKLSEIDAQKRSIDMASVECDQVLGKEQLVSAASDFTPGADVAKPENDIGSAELNGFIDMKRDANEGKNTNTPIGTKGLDSESSCTQNGLCLDANNESDLCTNGKNIDTNGLLLKPLSESDGMQNSVEAEMVNEKNDIKVTDSSVLIKEDKDSVHQNHSGIDSFLKVDGEMQRNSELNSEPKCSSNFRGVEKNDHAASHADKELCSVLGDDSNSKKETISTAGPKGCLDLPMQEPRETSLLEKNSSAVPDPQSCSGSQLLVSDKAHEDSILEEARIIEAKRKRIAELSVGVVPLQSRRKSQWDFVLEEMEWLANDFAQERLWKMTTAAQICHRVAFTSRLRVEEQNQCWKLKRVAYNLAKAVMQFWQSMEMLLNKDDQYTDLKSCKHDSKRFGADGIFKDKFEELDKEKCKEFEVQNLGKNLVSPIQGYAVRFLKCNSSVVPSLQAEAPSTPDRVADSGFIGISWEDQLTEESLFYAVPSGAMETYRISIESHLVQCEKTGNSMQEEVDTSMYDPAAEFGYRENTYDEEEGETSTYYLHGALDGSRSTKHDQKRKKNLMKTNSLRSYELGVDSTYGHYAAASQQNNLIGKRPASNLHLGSIPTKRVRSAASRQRFISPFNAGATATPAKTDASSGDTSSFQDDQSTLHGGSQIQKSIEVESTGDFEKQLPYDSAETTTKPKKKKKAKNLGCAYDQGWQLDSTVHNEQRDHSKKRLESHHFDSNGTSGLLYGQHPAKKLKLMKQSMDGTLDNMAPMMGSIPSPAASQMSNMPSTSKMVKIVGNKDKGRKPKSLKVTAGQPGSGSPWLLSEDQALVVLVHDMGPNWELVSDAINSALQFKCMFRKPIECKERHKILMDKGAGDGADSADDSGSSQSYPSTLPGIPKATVLDTHIGSARQLFQRLRGPMEEDTLKSHFEKIIMIGKKYHFRRTQNDNLDPKQIVAVHNSHLAALDQVPTSPNGGALTPLDLCDTTASSPETLPNGYPNSHATGLPLSNQSAVGSVLPTSGANSSLQPSPGVVLGSNSSPSGPLNAPVRDGRYSVPRTSLPVDEQQRLHYNQMLSNRNLQQSNLPVSGADRGVRMVPGNTVGMMPGINRSMSLPRPGFQGIASSSMLNSNSMLSSGMVGMPSPVSMQSGSSSGQGNSMMRSRDGLHMVRTGASGNNSEHQRQMMVPELQMQVSQGTSQGVPAFSGMSSSFANQTTPPAVQGYPGHSQQQHQMPPQQSHVMSNTHLQGANHSTGSPQQAYAIRLAKDRQMQQRLLQQQHQQQQQQFAASGVLMPHVTSQPQLPMSSSMQSSSQVQPQTSTQPVSLAPLAPTSPMTPVSVQQQQQKHTLPHHGINRNSQTVASGLTNQVGKQRPRQPQQHQQFQQSGRVHPQQRQHSQSPQQAKVLKGMGRGNVVVHQNLGIDHSHLNGLSVPPSNQSAEKGEHIIHMMQGKGLYSGTGLSAVQPSKPLATQSSNHSQPPSKLFSASAPPPSKQMQQMPSHSDNSMQGQVSSVSGHTLSAAHQALPPAIIASNHQQMQPTPQIHQKQSGQPAIQRILQQNRQLNSDLQNKSQTDPGHVEKPVIAPKVPQMVTNTVTSASQGCNDSTNKLPNVTTATSQWKHSETPSDTVMENPASQVSSVGSAPLTNMAGNEPVASVNSGSGQRKLSGGMPQHGSAGAQRQQQQQPQQSTPPPSQPSSQPLFQTQEQQLPEQQSPRQQLPPQQKLPHLQSAQGTLYIRPTNSQLE